jgi:hypothetical protein
MRRIETSGPRLIACLTVATAVVMLSGCTAANDEPPIESTAPRIEATPQPGDAEYRPTQDEACGFMVGERGEEFLASIGTAHSDLTAVEDVEGMVRGSENGFLAAFEPILDRSGLVCMLAPPSPGEFVVFAWAPIEESERDGIIGSLQSEGHELSDTEGGAVLAFPDDEFAKHIVTNNGWYYSTQQRGAEFLRTVFED